MAAVEIPNRDNARKIKIPIDVSTKVDGEKVAEPFEAEVPATLWDAVALEGEKVVFRMYMQSKVIKLQAEKRTELLATRGGEEKRPRSKAKWIDELGL